MEGSVGIADLALRFGIALQIGVLIGVEREYARLREEVKSFAGVRTFPLIALLGCSAALLTELGGEWTFGILALLLGLFIAISYAFDTRGGRVGSTSETAAIVVFVCGALLLGLYGIGCDPISCDLWIPDPQAPATPPGPAHI